MKQEGFVFLKKKKQKDFYPFCTALNPHARRQWTKVFWFFFQKRTLPFFLTPSDKDHRKCPAPP
jgi:hypothetical protein